MTHRLLRATGLTGLLLDGKVVTTYHYSATHEFPYSLGCFHGTPG